MNSAFSLLQTALVLLQTISANPTADVQMQQQAIATAANSIASAYQLAMVQGVLPKFARGNQYPTIEDVRTFAFVDSKGVRHTPGDGVARIVESSVSFGDINGDNFDDVAIVVHYASGGNYYLVPLINQVGALKQFGSVLLGKNIEVVRHEIDYATVTYVVRDASGERTVRYKLSGSGLKLL